MGASALEPLVRYKILDRHGDEYAALLSLIDLIEWTKLALRFGSEFSDLATQVSLPKLAGHENFESIATFDDLISDFRKYANATADINLDEIFDLGSIESKFDRLKSEREIRLDGAKWRELSLAHSIDRYIFPVLYLRPRDATTHQLSQVARGVFHLAPPPHVLIDIKFEGDHLYWKVGSTTGYGLSSNNSDVCEEFRVGTLPGFRSLDFAYRILESSVDLERSFRTRGRVDKWRAPFGLSFDDIRRDLMFYRASRIFSAYAEWRELAVRWELDLAHTESLRNAALPLSSVNAKRREAANAWRPKALVLARRARTRDPMRSLQSIAAGISAELSLELGLSPALPPSTVYRYLHSADPALRHKTSVNKK